MQNNNKKLLLVGASGGSVHLLNYHQLVQGYFKDILVVTEAMFDAEQCKVLDFSIRNPLKVLKTVSQLKKIIQEFNPDIIHVHQANSYAFITALANAKRKPLVLTAWGSDVLVLPNKGFLLKQMVRYGLKSANYITADAQYMLDAISRLTGNKNLILANFGIEPADARQPEKQNIVYSNRLHKPLYRIEKIIEGFARFRKNNPDWQLVVGATGSSTEKLKQLAADLLPEDACEFIGFVDREENMRQYLKARVWASFPESDGTAISLLEAMAYGCVPVLSDLPANKEWVEDGVNGIIVESKDFEQGLSNALQLDHNKVSEINAEIIESRATKVVNRKLFCNIYDNILKHG